MISTDYAAGVPKSGSASAAEGTRSCLVGVLAGEGAAPEVVAVAVKVLREASELHGFQLEMESGGPIGTASFEESGRYLSPLVECFCRNIFRRGGAVLAGAAGGRFVYDARLALGLYYKLNPIRSYPELSELRRVRLREETDLLVVRENLSGLYHGIDRSEQGESGEGRKVLRTFCNIERDVRRVVREGIRLAQRRRGELTMVCKEAGLGATNALWREVATEEASGAGMEVKCIDIDLAAYLLVQEPWRFDVIVAANCFGDVLADLGGVLCGGRGVTYGASFSADGAAVYQTNHGAAHDLAGRDIANPAGQIFSVAMMLRESFGMLDAAGAVEAAVRRVWGQKIVTEDLYAGLDGAQDGRWRSVGTSEFGEAVLDALRGLSGAGR